MTVESQRATAAFREKARKERELGTLKHHPATTHYPDWICNNCHREFPPDTSHVACPGKYDPGSRKTVACGGILVRWKDYEVKVS